MAKPPFLLLFLMFFSQILTCIITVGAFGKCLSDQRLTLLQFRDGLLFDSTLSNKLVHWNQSGDCCSWGGVACDVVGHVISLELDNETISVKNEDWKSLFTLRHLERLNLGDNNFDSVEIPEELSNLTRLKCLNLSNTGFTGQIPLGLSRMKSLVTLDLSNRLLDRRIQTENIPGGLKALFNNLTELRELYLDSVNISAEGSLWCDVFSSLSKLQVLSLTSCHLSGPITSSLLDLSSLTTLTLDNNNLSTVVPEFFSSFTNLTSLSVVSCNLMGKFPEKIFQLPTLQRVLLSDNPFLRGSLPEFPNQGSFTEIILSETNFSGSLPDSIGNLQALSRIDLWTSNFSGPIPANLSNLENVVYLDLSYNKFNGSVPSFQMSKKLVHVDLSHNSFTGPVPFAQYADLRDLESINLGYNSLTGNIPLSLFTLPSLQKLQLSNNKFDGLMNEIPNASSSLLDVLDLSSNYLGGSIPKFIFELKRLSVLSLSWNTFSGTVSLEMFQGLPQLSELDLSYNNLSIDASSNTGTSLSSFPQLSVLMLASCNLKIFPDVIKNQSGTFNLDLSLNHITGQIPNWIWDVGGGYLGQLNLSFNLLAEIQKPYTIPSALLVLDLHANQLRGEIPTPPLQFIYLDYSSNNFNTSIPPNIGDYLSNAVFLSLSNNSITGAIPESICNATYIEVLDLSKNALSGKLPACLLGMEDLGVLNLGENNLHGLIPNTFPDKCGLRTLDLRMNALEGKIPRSLQNCKQLQVLNVGKNKMEDIFPCMLMKATDLQVLVLRSNRFQGETVCPRYNHSWKSLQILDIAHNNFSGALSPKHFFNWRVMMTEEDNEAKYLQFGFMELSNLYYKDAVTLTIKGLELELVKILRVYKVIDFSGNKFHGQIPMTIGELKQLYILNLSHNSLTGMIPEAIGNCTQLGVLDLSMNQLTGMIPVKLAGLTFLSFLNLSYNQLSGEIPVGRQLQTFTDASFYGNRGLCGFPLSISCNKSEANGLSWINASFESERDSSRNEIEWEYVSAALGFSVGLGIISWLNFSSPRWWEKFIALVLQLLLRILHRQVRQKYCRTPIRRL
ncbi:receptor-like protein 40 [Coffea eugenioides]|uniref:receptor-like protein 40 n=1 Tax=Coffea eugenioides TaxID=49369 RepID=UPI000F60E9EE|nr:receptor-like protein 40 [Coffea eugenioides]